MQVSQLVYIFTIHSMLIDKNAITSKAILLQRRLKKRLEERGQQVNNLKFRGGELEYQIYLNMVRRNDKKDK